ncbi:hypothetical protein ACFFTN_00190 [Aminobacter aganoensis]|uniref:Uncharacterized protein n=1 Tax=Aminobacter aganoensis TaxID=83264 RepID=A0A7X0KK64_9HYPH|nr:hypothetical protein [Aminobacter aganoensis]MBB6353729.1 hypothetical protein [Aminobacter aganoensis]
MSWSDRRAQQHNTACRESREKVGLAADAVLQFPDQQGGQALGVETAGNAIWFFARALMIMPMSAGVR